MLEQHNTNAVMNTHEHQHNIAAVMYNVGCYIIARLTGINNSEGYHKHDRYFLVFTMLLPKLNLDYNSVQLGYKRYRTCSLCEQIALLLAKGISYTCNPATDGMYLSSCACVHGHSSSKCK